MDRICNVRGISLRINGTLVLLLQSSGFVCMSQMRAILCTFLTCCKFNQTLDWGASRPKILFKGTVTEKRLKALHYTIGLYNFFGVAKPLQYEDKTKQTM